MFSTIMFSLLKWQFVDVWTLKRPKKSASSGGSQSLRHSGLGSVPCHCWWTLGEGPATHHQGRAGAWAQHRYAVDIAVWTPQFRKKFCQRGRTTPWVSRDRSWTRRCVLRCWTFVSGGMNICSCSSLVFTMVAEFCSFFQFISFVTLTHGVWQDDGIASRPQWSFHSQRERNCMRQRSLNMRRHQIWWFQGMNPVHQRFFGPGAQPPWFWGGGSTRSLLPAARWLCSLRTCRRSFPFSKRAPLVGPQLERQLLPRFAVQQVLGFEMFWFTQEPFS